MQEDLTSHFWKNEFLVQNGPMYTKNVICIGFICVSLLLFAQMYKDFEQDIPLKWKSGPGTFLH